MIQLLRKKIFTKENNNHFILVCINEIGLFNPCMQFINFHLSYLIYGNVPFK